MKIKTLLGLFLLIFSVSCSTKINALREKEGLLESENNLGNVLGLKYLRYADILEKNGDTKSAKHFSDLAVDAAFYNRYGEEFKEKFSENNSVEQIADMYFLFNCWYYFETNNKNLGEATICKNSFLELYKQLERSNKIAVNPEDKVVNNTDFENLEGLSKKEEVIYRDLLKKQNIDIFFDYDSFKLNDEANERIKVLLKYINNLKTSYKISVIGHADRIGKTIYNNSIAAKRANIVFNALIKNGVPQASISVKSLSSKSPKVITKQNDKNQLNRRVEIIIDTDYKQNDVVPQPLRFIK